jgi:hypothetical protein
MAIPEEAVARLAVEYWKLLRMVERAVSSAPEDSRERLASQARYAIARFESILMEHKMSIQEFDGENFEVNLPVSPVNREELEGDGPLIIERTIEPTVIHDMQVILTGRVLLARRV